MLLIQYFARISELGRALDPSVLQNQNLSLSLCLFHEFYTKQHEDKKQ